MDYLIFLAILLLTPLAALCCILWIWQLQRRLSRRRSPLTRELARPPGYTLMDKVDELSWETSLAGDPG